MWGWVSHIEVSNVLSGPMDTKVSKNGMHPLLLETW